MPKNVWGSIKAQVWISEEKRKRREIAKSERKGLQTLFQVGVRAIVYDNSSAASTVSVVESTPEVDRTSIQPSASLSTEKANSSSLQDDFQISEPKVIKSTESTQLNSIQTFPLTQGLLSVAALTYECDVGVWQDLIKERIVAILMTTREMTLYYLKSTALVISTL